jgi:beta-lactamase class A
MRATTRTAVLAVVLATAVGLAGCTAADPDGVDAGRTTGATPSVRRSDAPTPRATTDPAVTRALDALEAEHDARLGLLAVDTGSGRTVSHRPDERFASASTGKVFIAAAVLDGSSDDDLDAVVPISRTDLLAYAPVTSEHVGSGMTVRALLDAMLRYSDNTAANLLVERVGGPSGVQRYLRGIGDTVTRVDRTEPDLNTAVPGDPRDTTTPAQAAADLRALLLGDALEHSDRDLLLGAMRANTTGAATIRAGVPTGWTVADKTGTGSYGVRNDIGVVTAPERAPVVVVVLTSRSTPDASPDDALVAAATRTAFGAVTG